jgi:carboxyl-terminal processing protease
MKKQIPLKYVLLIVAFFTAAAVIITSMCFFGILSIRKADDINGYASKLREIEALVDKYYVGDVDSITMADYISAGYVSGLEDKYAGYITALDAEENMNSLIGINTGMGILISQHPDTLNMFVLNVHDKSPAMEAGIKSGDQVVEVDGNVVATYGYTETLQYIKTQPIGTVVGVKLLRNGQTLDVNVTLKSFINQSVFYEVLGDYGFIHITEFNDNSIEQFRNAVDVMLASNVKGLIFDLRGNGGGTLTSVYHMLDYLIPEGLAVRVEYKDKNQKEVYMSDEREVNLPMVVLTDGNTASASELFTQGLKDYGKAVSIGRLTYGKGVVQRTFTLSDGSLVRFTVGKYYTANGTCLDGIGVIPDIKIELSEEETAYRLVNGLEKDRDYLAAVEYLDGQPS